VLFILFLLIYCSIQAQCPTGDITLDSQQAINDFVSQYPNCTDITGNVNITSSEVNDLSLLTQLTTIEGTLHIEWTDLTDMQGLNNLTSVGTLYLIYNYSLVNLTGLESLSTVDRVQIGDYFILIQETFFLTNALTSLAGLDNLSSVRTLEIIGNPALTDLSSLNNLTSLQTLHLRYNESLSNLTGLENLTSVESLGLYYNFFLTSLAALENLTSVKSLDIQNNYSLVNLVGLENMEPDTLTNVYIRSNPNLAICQLESICNYLQTGGTSYIAGNGPGCNNLTGIIDATCDLSGQCGIILTNQAEVNSFATDYPDCTELAYLAISSPAIHDLSPLSQITSVEGTLLIERTHLIDLTGLNNLTSAGYLMVMNNDSLVNLTGLENLNTAGSVLIGSYTYNTFTPDSYFYHSYINDLQNKALINLAGLDNLSSISNDLIISRNDSLAGLTGLNNLTTIGNDLDIQHNDNLADLIGLNNLTTIGEDLNIERNENIAGLTDLNNLTTIGEILNIEWNKNLADLTDLNNLTTVGGDLNIEYNENLADLTGLNNLTTIGDDLNIEGNDNLADLNGLDNLTSIGWYLNIERNDNLANLIGLSNLTSVGRSLYVQRNDNLVSLSGLQNVDPNTLTYVAISQNDSLSICQVASICNYLQTASNSSVYSNASGCNSTTEVLDACSFTPSVYADIFYDLNQNGTKEANEPNYYDASISIMPGDNSLYAQTGVLYIEPGTYTATFDEISNPNWQLTTMPPSYTFSLDEGESDTITFGIYPIEQISDAQTIINSPPARCNESIPFDVGLKNLGTTVVNGIMWFTIDEETSVSAFVQQPDTMIANTNTYGWYFSDL